MSCILIVRHPWWLQSVQCTRLYMMPVLTDHKGLGPEINTVWNNFLTLRIIQSGYEPYSLCLLSERICSHCFSQIIGFSFLFYWGLCQEITSRETTSSHENHLKSQEMSQTSAFTLIGSVFTTSYKSQGFLLLKRFFPSFPTEGFA